MWFENSINVVCCYSATRVSGRRTRRFRKVEESKSTAFLHDNDIDLVQ